MRRFILQRLLTAIPTLLAIVTLAFFLLRAAPGGPFDQDKPMLPAIKASIEKAYHLDESLPVQYMLYLGQLARGDLGPSFQYADTRVSQLIASGFPIDLTLGALALLLALVVGTPLGAWAARRPGGGLDRAVQWLAPIGISLPVYVTAPLLVHVFAVLLQWLPAGDWNGGQPKHLVLPVLALALPYIAFVLRISRASFGDVLQQPFIRTARAKGLPESTVLFRHALRPALVPLVAFLGPATVGAITGSIAIETTFALPGIGRHFVEGAFNRDYTLVMGITILYGVLIVCANFVVDVVQALLDPRIRLQ